MQIAKDSKAGKSYPSMGITQQGTEMGNAETIEVQKGDTTHHYVI